MKGYFINLDTFESIGEYTIQKKVNTLMPCSLYRELMVASCCEDDTNFFVFDMKD